MDLKTSPLAPDAFPNMPAVEGVHMWVGETGVKYKDRPDLLLVSLVPGSRVAGVFTKSEMPGAPVIWSKSILKFHEKIAVDTQGLGILVNSGNANVYTGEAGEKTVTSSAEIVAQKIDIPTQNIFVASTGVIGEPLDVEPIKLTLNDDDFFKRPASWEEAAQAISTTDTYLKGSHARVEIDGAPINICGIVKGSGMIAPNMATMLGFIFTDANIARPVLQTLLTELSETSFNAITVDSDASTSDTVLLAATAQADHVEVTDIEDPRLRPFKQALSSVMRDLAHQVVKDGEGAQKFIEIAVTGAQNDTSAKNIAMSIANSPLVKTAIAGEDANWGRIIMAIGKSGENVDNQELEIAFGPHIVAKNGARSETYSEADVSEYIKNSKIEIRVDIGVGRGGFTAWTCDLTHGYIDINADYRT